MRKLIGVLGILALCSAPVLADGSYGGGPFDFADDAYDGSLGSMGSSSVTVPGGEPGGDIITDINVVIDASHTWVGDLTIKLEGPGGLMTLMARPGFAEPADDGEGCCGSSSDLIFGNTQTFIDGGMTVAELIGDSGNPIPMQTVDPDAGSLGDSSFAASFGGTNAVGDWTLYIGDGAGGDTGSVESWTLNLRTVPEPASLMLLLIGGVALLRRR